MIEARIFVSHDVLPVEVMESRISIAPSEMRRREALRPDGVGVYGHNAWMIDLEFPDAIAGDEEGLSAAVVALGTKVADEIASLAEDGCFVSLRMYQEVHGPDDGDSIGLIFSPECIAWLARARAHIDLDQAFLPGRRFSSVLRRLRR